MFQSIRNLLSLLSLLVLTACVSTTKIEALNPEGKIDDGVQIYVEGRSIGAGSALYSDSSPRTAFASKAVQLRKAGCQTRREELKSKINIPKFIGAMVVAFGGGGLIGLWSVDPPADSLILNFSLIGAVIIAAVLPSLWANDYKPLHSYDFHCAETK